MELVRGGGVHGGSRGLDGGGHVVVVSLVGVVVGLMIVVVGMLGKAMERLSIVRGGDTVGWR